MKTYVIILSQNFMAKHPKAGEPTYFGEKFLKGQGKYAGLISKAFGDDLLLKIHTIRGNFPLWEKRISEIEQGAACLSIRQWSGKPYNSKQIELARLTKDDGIGLQTLRSRELDTLFIPSLKGNVLPHSISDVAENDGLSVEDFKEWFKNNPTPTQPFAIIHFTKFRY